MQRNFEINLRKDLKSFKKYLESIEISRRVQKNLKKNLKYFEEKFRITSRKLKKKFEKFRKS